MKKRGLLELTSIVLTSSIIYVGILLLATGGLGNIGCSTLPVSSSLTKIDGGAANIIKSAEHATSEANQITGETNAPHKEAILNDLSSITIDAKGIHFNSGEAKQADVKKDKELKRYKENPLVAVAMFIWTWGKWICIILGIYIALNIVATILGTFNPQTAAWKFSQGMVRALPLMNPSRWVNDIMGKGTVAVKAEVIPVVPTPVVANTPGAVVENTQ